MSQPPYRVDEEDHTTLGLLDPPGPPGYPAPPGTQPPGGSSGDGDRVWVHLVWEAFLFFVVLGLFVVVRGADSRALSGSGLDGFVYQAAALGILATGLSFSLRAAVPNLAVGAIAASAGVVVAELSGEHNWGVRTAVAVALAGGLVVGMLLAVIVVGFHVPAWAASLGASVLVSAVVFGAVGSDFTQFSSPLDNISLSARIFFGIFAVISVLGGLIWLAPGVRRGFGGMRQDRDAARRAGGGAAAGATIALVVSSILAAGAGVITVLRTGSAQGQVGDNLTWIALGAVLLGGVSVFGRRAGIFGTLLGVLLLSLIQRWLVVESVDAWVFSAITGGAILVGLIVNRILEAAGRKPAPPWYY
jgi:ribose/xylose/arabinose/galactoside ABC-type transport system permease subunit